jgi:DNA-binding SARP family transcriptional activator
MKTVHGNSLRFAVLGPVRAWRGERELDLGSPQQRVVLAILLLRRGRLVTLAEFVDALWGEEPPTAAVSVLRTYVSRLRKVLESGRDDSASPRVIVSAADGYLVRVPDDALDLNVFEQRVARARQLRAAGDLSAAADLLHAALDGWDATPLAGLSGPLAEAERARLNEERLSTLEARLDLDVQLGRHRDVIAGLSALAAEHPLREQLCRLLMLALYRSGRQAEALAAYRRTRSTLVRELGIEPGPELAALHDSILAADPSLGARPAARPQEPAHAPAPSPASSPISSISSPLSTPAGSPASSSDTPPAATPDAPPAASPAVEVPAEPAAVRSTRPAQLPADLPAFTGRGAELERIRALLPEIGSHPATVVITAIGGMAGIGKTTLAVHWAHEIADRFPDGQLFINLRGFDPTGAIVPPEEAVRIFLDALDVPAQRIPASLDAQALLYRSLLANRRVLIVLDNARDVDQVRPLLPGSPGCLVIVTSRNQLSGLIASDGAHPLTLHQLAPAEALDFLERRLGTARPSAEPLAAEEIIDRCARLPLALAIVAARAATNPGFPLSAIAEELRECHGSLDAFAGEDLSTDVRAVFSWSYEALSEPAARLFRLLGLRPGADISAPAAAALAGLPLRETRGLLVELTRAHLLAEHLPGRFTMHDLLRVYAAERVLAEESPEERDRAVDRLLSWYLHTADAAYPLLTPHRRRVPLEPLPEGCRPLAFTEHDQALKWCETERTNLVAAVHLAATTGRPGIAWRLGATLWGFFYLRSHLHDWLDVCRTGLAAARSAADREGEASGLAGVASALTQLNRYDEAIEYYWQEMVLRRDLKDVRGRSQAVANLGNAYLQSGRLKKSIEYSRRGLAVDRATGEPWGEGISLVNLGDAYQRLGRFDEANQCLQEALTVLRSIGNRWVEGAALDILGTVEHRLRRYDSAVEHYRQALLAHRDVGNRWGEGHTLGNLGDVQLATGEPHAARTSWRQALTIFTEAEHPDAEKIRERLARLDEATPESGSVHRGHTSVHGTAAASDQVTAVRSSKRA